MKTRVYPPDDSYRQRRPAMHVVGPRCNFTRILACLVPEKGSYIYE
ncbi:MAG: hypothetical protein WBI82_07425 [Sphaerochaeta sp.]